MRTARSGNYVVCISTMRHNSRSYFTPEIGISHFCTTTSLQFHHFCTVVYQPQLWGVSSTPLQFHFLVHLHVDTLHIDIVSSLLVLFATRMATQMILVFISVDVICSVVISQYLRRDKDKVTHHIKIC